MEQKEGSTQIQASQVSLEKPLNDDIYFHACEAACWHTGKKTSLLSSARHCFHFNPSLSSHAIARLQRPICQSVSVFLSISRFKKADFLTKTAATVAIVTVPFVFGPRLLGQMEGRVLAEHSESVGSNVVVWRRAPERSTAARG